MKRQLFFAMATTALALGLSNASAQVRTVTLGITTHCPYGVGGCWAEIKNGLPMEQVAAVPERPDTKTQTFDLHMRDDWKPDPNLFARNFRAMNVGVDVRGVEATIDGVVEAEGKNLVLRVNGTATTIALAPLKRTVHWDTQKNRPAPLTRAEKRAFEKLNAELRQQPAQVRVTGPLVHTESAGGKPARQTLEVRKFELLKPATAAKLQL